MAKSQTTISSKFQIVIPREIRTSMGLKTGEVLQVVGKGGVISLIPDRPTTELRGFLKGMKDDFEGLPATYVAKRARPKGRAR